MAKNAMLVLKSPRPRIRLCNECNESCFVCACTAFCWVCVCVLIYFRFTIHLWPSNGFLFCTYTQTHWKSRTSSHTNFVWCTCIYVFIMVYICIGQVYTCARASVHAMGVCAAINKMLIRCYLMHFWCSSIPGGWIQINWNQIFVVWEHVSCSFCLSLFLSFFLTPCRFCCHHLWKDEKRA